MKINKNYQGNVTIPKSSAQKQKYIKQAIRQICEIQINQYTILQNHQISIYNIINIIQILGTTCAQSDMLRIHKPISQIKNIEYLPDLRVYMVAVINDQSQQIVYLPQYLFYHATLKSNVKQEDQCKAVGTIMNDADLHRTILCTKINQCRYQIDEKIQERNQLEETVVYRSRTENPNEGFFNNERIINQNTMKPFLDYDSLLENPNFRTVWKIRNDRIFVKKQKSANKKSTKKYKKKAK